MLACGEPPASRPTAHADGGAQSGGEVGGDEVGGDISSGASSGGGTDGNSGGQLSAGGSTVGGAPVGGSPAGTGAGSGDGTDSSSGGEASGGGSSGGDVAGARPSPGCTAPTETSSGRHDIEVDGVGREYILEAPAGSGNIPLPLIFGFHGLMYDAEWVANGEAPLTGPYFGMAQEASGQAIFVAPQALSGGFSNQDGRDIAFVEAMVRELTARLCVDEARVFATGFSIGGIMTTAIGCELFAMFRAVAPQSARLADSCREDLPSLGYLGTHGQQDQTIQLASGEAVRDSYLTRNQCTGQASAPDANGCITYSGCDVGSPVVWCTFSGEHVPSPYVGPALWAFFSQF